MHIGPTAPTFSTVDDPDYPDAKPHWFLGLPIDCLSMGESRALIFHAIRHRQRLIFATPNVSFFALAHRKPDFRRILLETDLSLMDSMPLTWLARAAGVPVPERVAGSDLIEQLLNDPDVPPTRLFFFGGMPGVADTACDAVNAKPGAVRAVGALDPGFGCVESMSTPEIIERINVSQADMLIVALGADKGHRWIEHNRDRLTIPVISHLGAVINFLAGTVRRAPAWMQRAGLEWLWRIREEPALAGRYVRDSGYLLRAVARTLRDRLSKALRARGAPLDIATGRNVATSRDGNGNGNGWTITLQGTFGSEDVATLDALLNEHRTDGETVTIDFSGVSHMDSGALGHLYALAFRRTSGSGCAVRLQCTNEALLRRHDARPLISSR